MWRDCTECHGVQCNASRSEIGTVCRSECAQSNACAYTRSLHSLLAYTEIDNHLVNWISVSGSIHLVTGDM